MPLWFSVSSVFTGSYPCSLAMTYGGRGAAETVPSGFFPRPPKPGLPGLGGLLAVAALSKKTVRSGLPLALQPRFFRSRGHGSAAPRRP
jgi:hypothetical protein